MCDWHTERYVGAHAVSDSDRSVSNLDTEAEITLGLLDAVEANSDVSQRSLARELGIALGLTNAYIKRCIRKGWIKASQAPANRYAYYITPKGLAEKGRLTTRYLAHSLHFYREARNQLDDILAHCAKRGWRRIALIGISELAEIALLCAMQHSVEIVCVVQRGSKLKNFRGAPVVTSLNKLSTVDAGVITALNRPQAAYDATCNVIPRECVLTPPLLKIGRGGNEEA